MLREKKAFPPKYREPTTPRPLLCPLIVWLDPYKRSHLLGLVLKSRCSPSCSVYMMLYITLFSFSLSHLRLLITIFNLQWIKGYTSEIPCIEYAMWSLNPLPPLAPHSARLSQQGCAAAVPRDPTQIKFQFVSSTGVEYNTTKWCLRFHMSSINNKARPLWRNR